MDLIRTTRGALIFTALAVMTPLWGQTPDEIEKIEKAMPATARVTPEKPRRVLVFSQALKFKHASIPYGEKAFQIMGEKTGAFKADISRDGAELTPENLAQYDAIIINNTTGDFITTPSLRQGLLDFVSSGKGIVGIHAASDSNFSWEEYGELIGGFFVNHPWTSKTKVTLKIENPDHPVNQAFKGPSFEVTDEIYQFREPYSREKLLVLASLDTEKTDMQKKGIERTDNDFAVSWVREWGDGRIFYCSLGHNPEIFWNQTVLLHYLDGIQFALGDLKATASASDNSSTQTVAMPRSN